MKESSMDIMKLAPDQKERNRKTYRAYRLCVILTLMITFELGWFAHSQTWGWLDIATIVSVLVMCIFNFISMLRTFENAFTLGFFQGCDAGLKDFTQALGISLNNKQETGEQQLCQQQSEVKTTTSN
jgi:hypothetical protein